MRYLLCVEHSDQHHEWYQKEEEVALVPKDLVYFLEEDKMYTSSYNARENLLVFIIKIQIKC